MTRLTPGTSICLLSLLATAGHAGAATYIIDNQNPRASDSNPGTKDAPLKTLGAGVRKAEAGDEVLVRPGIYRENMVLDKSGRAGQPIVFRSEVPGAAVICGSDVLTDWKVEGPGIWSASTPDLVFNKWGNAEWVYVNGYPLQNADSRSLLAPGTFFLDYDARRVFVAPEEGQDIARLKVEYAHREGLVRPVVVPRPPGAGGSEPMKSLDDIHILGFTVLHNADWFRGRRPITASGRRWLIEGNHVLWSSYGGISTRGTNGCVIRNNVVEWCGNACIGGGENLNLTVENNIFRFGNWRRFRPTAEGGISKWVNTYDSLIRNNEAAYFYGYGLWTDVSDANNLYEGNVVHDSTSGAALFTEISWGDIFRGNVAYNNETGITLGESPSSAALRNVVFNNGTGIRMRGNFRREISPVENRPGEAERYLNLIKTIPDISEVRVAQLEAAFLTYQAAPKYHMSTNSLVWNNLMFDNGTNYFEHRNYGAKSDDDPFINNFSDYNLFYQADPDANVRRNDGGYGSLENWRQVSGRDAHSTIADPRDPATKLPDWAAARRPLWEGLKHKPAEIKALRLGLVESPSAALLTSRLMQSEPVRMLPLHDPRIKACLFELDGQRTLAVWTSQLADRRYVRLKVGANEINFENAFGGRAPRTLENGTLELAATYLPVYLRGVGETVSESSATTLTASAFNAPGQAVNLTATVVNDSNRAQNLSVTFSASPGFQARPAQVTRSLAPGESAQLMSSLQPDGSFLRGSALARMEAKIGTESLVRTASFAVGEGGGQIPALAQPLRVDGDLADWTKLGASAQLGVITDVGQLVQGNDTTWSGPKDLSARIYGIWRKDALYIAVAVTDDKIVPASAGGTAWSADAVEVFLDGRSSEMQWQKEPSEGVVQIGVSPNADKPVPTILSKSPVSEVTAGVSRRPDGYTVEIRIPLTAENFPAGAWNSGRPVKLSVLVDDKDDPKQDRDTVLGWSFSPGGKNFSDTSGWKTVILE